MFGAIKERLSEFQKLSCVTDTGEKGMQAFPQKHMTKKIRLTQIEEEIITANVTNTEGRLKQITNHVKAWETLSFEDRQAVLIHLSKSFGLQTVTLKSLGTFNFNYASLRNYFEEKLIKIC